MRDFRKYIDIYAAGAVDADGADQAVPANHPINQNILLTTIQEKPTTINPIAAFFNTLNPALYLVSSPAEVTIWKPPYNAITNVMIDNNPKIQLINDFTIVIGFEAPAVPQAKPNACQASHWLANPTPPAAGCVAACTNAVDPAKIPNVAIPTTISAFITNFFMWERT